MSTSLSPVTAKVSFTPNVNKSPVGTFKNKVTALFQSISESDLWANGIKPFYVYRIKPIGRWDFLSCTTSVGVAGLIMKTSIVALGMSTFAAASIPSFAVIFWSLNRSNERICQIYKDETWDDLDLIRRNIIKLSNKNNDITACHERLTKITKDHQLKPMPQDVKDLINQIHKELDNFAAIIQQTPHDTIKAQFIDLLASIKTPLTAAQKLLLDNLETEINKIGTKDEDMIKTKKCLHAVDDIVHEHIDKKRKFLREDYDSLKKSIELKIAENNKRVSLTEHIKKIQEILNPHRDVAKLVDIENENKKTDKIEDKSEETETEETEEAGKTETKETETQETEAEETESEEPIDDKTKPDNKADGKETKPEKDISEKFVTPVKKRGLEFEITEVTPLDSGSSTSSESVTKKEDSQVEEDNVDEGDIGEGDVGEGDVGEGDEGDVDDTTSLKTPAAIDNTLESESSESDSDNDEDDDVTVLVEKIASKDSVLKGTKDV
ncbi:MAG: hypothetical protein H0W88_12545 [Parachlamydiaceae bacterium]|nr:hypothetical protein [Parachlamydiaceae bacterium]